MQRSGRIKSCRVSSYRPRINTGMQISRDKALVAQHDLTQYIEIRPEYSANDAPYLVKSCCTRLGDVAYTARTDTG